MNAEQYEKYRQMYPSLSQPRKVPKPSYVPVYTQEQIWQESRRNMLETINDQQRHIKMLTETIASLNKDNYRYLEKMTQMDRVEKEIKELTETFASMTAGDLSANISELLSANKECKRLREENAAQRRKIATLQIAPDQALTNMQLSDGRRVLETIEIVEEDMYNCTILAECLENDMECHERLLGDISCKVARLCAESTNDRRGFLDVQATARACEYRLNFVCDILRKVLDEVSAVASQLDRNRWLYKALSYDQRINEHRRKETAAASASLAAAKAEFSKQSTAAKAELARQNAAAEKAEAESVRLRALLASSEAECARLQEQVTKMQARLERKSEDRPAKGSVRRVESANFKEIQMLRLENSQLTGAMQAMFEKYHSDIADFENKISQLDDLRNQKDMRLRNSMLEEHKRQLTELERLHTLQIESLRKSCDDSKVSVSLLEDHVQTMEYKETILELECRIKENEIHTARNHELMSRLVKNLQDKNARLKESYQNPGMPEQIFKEVTGGSSVICKQLDRARCDRNAMQTANEIFVCLFLKDLANRSEDASRIVACMNTTPDDVRAAIDRSLMEQDGRVIPGVVGRIMEIMRAVMCQNTEFFDPQMMHLKNHSAIQLKRVMGAPLTPREAIESVRIGRLAGGVIIAPL